MYDACHYALEGKQSGLFLSHAVSAFSVALVPSPPQEQIDSGFVSFSGSGQKLKPSKKRTHPHS